MFQYPAIDLAKDLGRHLRLGHPWVFAKALPGNERHPAGAIVDLQEAGRFVARGFWDPQSPIRVRILTRDPLEKIDGNFWRRRIARAAALRREVIATDKSVDAYRLVHGESDNLPALVVDRYAAFLVTKIYSAGLTPHRDAILAALRAELPELKGIFGREELSRDDADDEASEGRGTVHFGEEPPEHITIHEHGATFLVDVRGGQKTGFFLDQRENRAALRRYARGREALNCFGYTGGFSVHLALGGARKVTTLDLDKEAIALAEQNFRVNGLDPEAHGFVRGDVFEYLAAAKAEGRSFDLVVLDPPAFAKSQKAVEPALDGYASLNRAALAVLRPGGILVTCSCSARVTPEEFLGAVAQAAAKAKIDLQLLEERHQPPDHPVALQFREGRYLKALILRRV